MHAQAAGTRLENFPQIGFAEVILQDRVLRSVGECPLFVCIDLFTRRTQLAADAFDEHIVGHEHGRARPQSGVKTVDKFVAPHARTYLETLLQFLTLFAS